MMVNQRNKQRRFGPVCTLGETNVGYEGTQRKTIRSVWNVESQVEPLSHDGFDPDWSQTTESESWFYHFPAVSCVTKRNTNAHGGFYAVIELCPAT